MLSLLDSAIDPQAIAIARVLTNPQSARIGYISNVISALKSAGIWSKYKACIDLCTANAADVGRDWVTPARALPTLVGTGVGGSGGVLVNKIADRWIYGDGASGLGLNFSPSTIGVTNSNLRIALWSADVNFSAASANVGRAR